MKTENEKGYEETKISGISINLIYVLIKNLKLKTYPI